MKTTTFNIVALAAASALVASCSYKPRFTPADVAPPESLADVLAEADFQRQLGYDPFAPDKVTTLTLSRDGAILTAIARNRSLAVERLNPQIAETFIAEERSAFDPTLLATISYGRNTEQLGGSRFQQSGAAAFNNSRFQDNSVRLENRLATGTEAFLTGGFDRTESTFTEREYSGSWSAGVTQSLLRGAGTSVNLVELRQATNDAAISVHQLRDFVIELTRQVEIGYWNLVLAYAELEIQEFSVALAEEQLRLNNIYLEVGKGVIGDVVSAEAALATREADLIDAKANLRRETIELIRLMNPDLSEQYAIAFAPQDPPDIEPVEVQPELSSKLAALYRPDLAEAKLRLANRDLEVIRTKNGLLPRLDLFATYGRTSLGHSPRGGLEFLDDSDFDNYEIGLDLEWQPLNRGARARNERAKFQQAQAEASISNLEQLIDAELYQAAVETRRQWERIRATEAAVQAREEELRAMREQFEVGLATTLDVLTIQEHLVEARLDAATARVRYIQSLTNLYAREGTLLDRRGVRLASDSRD